MSSRWLDPVLSSTPTTRIVNQVAAGLCFFGALLYPAVYGIPMTFGLLGFYVALQSGVLHTTRFAIARELPASLRFATAGISMGVCLSVHAFVRFVRSEAHLEYIGGPPITTVAHGVTVGLNHVVIPLASLVHLRGIGLVHPLRPILLASVEISVVALLHEWTVADSAPRALVEGSAKAQTLILAAVSAGAWALLFETVNRFFVRRT